ncbi:MAG: hypothetical protein EP297_13820 [Gammaproteobacteria bacterium]|nr:MAG: hypothetical protein EP297_13820 [Gammaproteobacteria bacterium]
MSAINQIQLSFAPVEDRLLLRLNTTDAAEFRFWLTRRYVKLLWPVLMKMLQDELAAYNSEEAKQEILSFQFQEAAQNMDYSTSFDENVRERPLGDVPILLARISTKKREDGTQLLSLHPEDGQGIDLALNQKLLHSICKLLQDALKKTDWDLDFSDTLSTNILISGGEPRTIQ